MSDLRATAESPAPTQQKCGSSYTAWSGLTLHCTGEHLSGNIMREDSTVHQARYVGLPWTWYGDEADR